MVRACMTGIRIILSRLLIILAMVSFTGCGGGGGAPSQPYSVTVKLSTVPADSTPAPMLNGVQVTIALPPGVTVRAGAGGVPDTGVVAASGVVPAGATLNAAYTPAGAGPGQLTVGLAYVTANPAEGFTVGEFATVNLDVAPGVAVTGSSLPLSNIAVYRNSGNDVVPVTGVTVTAAVVP